MSSRKPESAITCRPLEVVARSNESIERLIRRFVKKVRNDGVLQEYNVRRSFEKGSSVRRRKRAAALRLQKIASQEKR